MSRPQQVAWFATKQEAVAFERKMHAQSLVNGQKCARWAVILEEKEGFGVPVKDRVLLAATIAERARIKVWAPPDVERI